MQSFLCNPCRNEPAHVRGALAPGTLKQLPLLNRDIILARCALGMRPRDTMMLERSRVIFMLVAVLLTSCERESPSSVAKRIAAEATPATTSSVTNNQSIPIAPTVVTNAGSPGSPVTASLGLDRVELHPGDVQKIVVELQIKPGWHIYAMDGPVGMSLPTRIKMELPAGIEARGAWSAPPIRIKLRRTRADRHR